MLRTIRLLNHDTAISGAPEGNPAARTDAQVVADRLWDCHLALSRNLGCHQNLQK
jgi:hypothetical protein